MLVYVFLTANKKLFHFYIVVYFDQQTHVFTWSKTMKNIQKSWKKYRFHHAHRGSWRKIEEKSLLVSDWEWLPKASCHPKAGCSFGITFFFIFVHGPYMSLLYAWQKSYFFHDFPMIFIVFRHAQAWICWSKYTAVTNFVGLN